MVSWAIPLTTMAQATRYTVPRAEKSSVIPATMAAIQNTFITTGARAGTAND